MLKVICFFLKNLTCFRISLRSSLRWLHSSWQSLWHFCWMGLKCLKIDIDKYKRKWIGNLVSLSFWSLVRMSPQSKRRVICIHKWLAKSKVLGWWEYTDEHKTVCQRKRQRNVLYQCIVSETCSFDRFTRKREKWMCKHARLRTPHLLPTAKCEWPSSGHPPVWASLCISTPVSVYDRFLSVLRWRFLL